MPSMRARLMVEARATGVSPCITTARISFGFANCTTSPVQPRIRTTSISGTKRLSLGLQLRLGLDTLFEVELTPLLPRSYRL